LLDFFDYILICYNYRIDIINYKDKFSKVKSLKYFKFELINIIGLSSNRIILGLYDSEKKESIIREHLLRIEDLENNKNIFDCIGQGILEFKKIKNIIKINESKILTNIKNDSCIIFERKNEVSEMLKKALMISNKIKEIIVNNKDIIA